MVQIISPFTCFYCSLNLVTCTLLFFFLGDFVAFCLFYAELVLFCFVMCKWKSAGGNVACVFTNNSFVISLAMTIFGVPAAMLTWGVGALCFFPVCMRRHSGRSHKFLHIFN